MVLYFVQKLANKFIPRFQAQQLVSLFKGLLKDLPLTFWQFCIVFDKISESNHGFLLTVVLNF
jgi:hypothetical protein